MYRSLIAALAIIAVLSPLPTHAPTPAPVGRAYAVATELPPCATEDSDNCVWDASSRGNGLGQSFTVRNGVVTYLP